MLSICLVACAAPLTASERPVVRELRLEGTRQLSEAEIKKKLLTRETGRWPLAEEQRFDESAWKSDLLRIERLYEARGYYGTRVAEQEVLSRPDGVALRVRVEEAPPSLIHSIAIQGLESLPHEQKAQLLEDFPFRQGQRFEQEQWNGLKERLRLRLLDLGYVEAAVRGEARVHPPTRAVAVDLSFEPGQRYRLGAIRVVKVAGARIAEQRIVEQAQALIAPGAWYSQRLLAEVQARVFELGVFSSVSVAPGAVNRQARTADVFIDAREAPFHTLRAGGGLGVDQSQNEARVLAEYVDRNFLGGLRLLRLRARAGWVFVPSFFAVIRDLEVEAPRNGPIARLLLDFEQPRVGRPDLKLYTSLQGERELEQAYSYFAARAEAGLVFSPHPEWSAQAAYRVELYRLDQPTPLVGETRFALGCPTPCVLSLLEQRLAWDRRDDRVEPRRGHFLGLSLQEGGGPLGGSFSYLRIQPDLRFYFPLSEQGLTLSARLTLGTLLHDPASDSPIVSRFFSGGASSMRGFTHQRLSPLLVAPLPQPEDGFEAQTFPIGGDGVVEASLELRYPLSKDFILAAFADSGWVSQRPLEASTVEQLQYALGGGVRYLTPIGPIRLDVAYRLPIGPPLPIVQLPNGPLSFPLRRGCLGFGGFSRAGAGAPEGVCAVHLTFGEAF